MSALAVSYSGLLGGAERVLLEIATRLPEPPLLACPGGPLARAAREQGLGVFELTERSLELRRSPRDRIAMPLRLAAHALEVREIVAGQRPDVVLAWGMRAALVLGAAYPRRRNRPPWLFQHHDLLPGPRIAQAVRLAAARADAVTACSRCVARDLDPSGTLGVQIVPLGVDLQRFEPGSPDGDSRSREALVLGAIERWKRPDLALEAIALAARELPDLRVRVLGRPIGADGERLLSELRARAERPDLAGRVDLAGSLADPRPALRRADCLLHCSDHEPYGMVVAEALASGLPVVAPDSCGPAEIVDAGCAALYEPGDPHAAAAALVRALGDEATASAMAKAARAHAERTLDVQATCRRFTTTIERLGGGDRPWSPRSAATGRRAGEELAIVTVIHQSQRELEALLRSVERYLPAAQVVVVDSGSTDQGVEVAGAWRGGVADVLSLAGNVGFGRGVNAGMAAARRPVTVLLNPDVELLDASLEAAVRELARRPDDLLAPLVLRPDGGGRQDSAQRSPGTAALAVHALLPGQLLPRALGAVVEPWRGVGPRPVGWGVGCALIARTDMLRRLGPFDERTFMYGEDLDLGLRVADAQRGTRFWPAARVLHRGAHSTHAAFGGEPIELLARRRAAVVRERRGALRAHADRVLQAATFRDRIALKRLVRQPAIRERRQLDALHGESAP